MRDLYFDKSVLSHLLDSQTPGGQRARFAHRVPLTGPGKLALQHFEREHGGIVERVAGARF